MGKINASDKITFQNHKKEKIWKEKIFGIILHLKWFRQNYSLLRQADARGSADIIYHI